MARFARAQRTFVSSEHVDTARHLAFISQVTPWMPFLMPLLAVLVVLLGSPQSALAEGQSLRGIVRDQTGPVLENARVEVVR